MNFTAEFLEKLNNNPLYQTLGIRIVKAENGRAESGLFPNKRVCWPFPGQPHGGILFTILDTTMAWAVVSLLDEGLNCATINLDINYSAPAKGDRFLCFAQTLYRAGKICFVRGDIKDSEGSVVALAQGAFRIIKYTLPG